MSRSKQATIGILTGGGDCPGLNAAIRAIVCAAIPLGYSVDGFLCGWEGVLKRKRISLRMKSVTGIIHQGGTILQTSRTNPYKDDLTEKQCYQALDRLDLEALIVIGGEDTLGVAARLARKGYPIIGIPKTIDNDVFGTDATIGFDTAVAAATEAIDRLHATAESHNRVIVVEVMGRHAGWIATCAGLAGGADVILIPEKPTQLESICKLLKQRRRQGLKYSIIVVAEGARCHLPNSDRRKREEEAPDEFGHVRLGGIGHALAQRLEEKTGFEARAVILGYLQRGGAPTAFDRILASRFGLKAVDLIRRRRFGRLVSWQKGQIKDVALSVVSKGVKTVDPALLRAAEKFVG